MLKLRIPVCSTTSHTEDMRKDKERGKKTQNQQQLGRNIQIFHDNLLPQHIQAALLPAEAHNFNSLQSNLIKMDMS